MEGRNWGVGVGIKREVCDDGWMDGWYIGMVEWKTAGGVKTPRYFITIDKERLLASLHLLHPELNKHELPN